MPTWRWICLWLDLPGQQREARPSATETSLCRCGGSKVPAGHHWTSGLEQQETKQGRHHMNGSVIYLSE